MLTLSRCLLADDIGATKLDTELAYKTLCEAGVLERAEYLPAPENPDCFRVRVALPGDNESVHSSNGVGGRRAILI